MFQHDALSLYALISAHLRFAPASCLGNGGVWPRGWRKKKKAGRASIRKLEQIAGSYCCVLPLWKGGGIEEIATALWAVSE